ncbi:ubiquitin-like modifier-activating enzyme 1 [Solea senegalensis]|uniref:E1 ubiquitin-activating enzyme n=1 Tax=Solea senegalensis TaxID=28829 RepID=A0AAV6QPP6_SOLSE|nr:ubiquitin-like modifier-activating enzyme 1 [Solea senegalensis]
MSATGNIDEGFYSRQLYVLGHEAMQRMATASVLIAGQRGLGVEIAKNVILSGVKSVTVQDEGLTEWTDLSSQFFLKESDLSQNRATCSLKQLSALNPHVQVSAHTGPVDEHLLLQHQVVVLTDSSLDDQKRFGEFCHSHCIKLIVADTKGLCGQLFCDFGEEFEVLDENGEIPTSAMVQSITKGNPGVVFCTDEHHGFIDGTKVSFFEVQGMTELNGIGPIEITVRNPYSFSIGDTSAFSEYESGGIVTEVKESCILHFKPLSEALSDYELLNMNDFVKTTRHKTLHLAFQALHGFVKKEQRLPRVRSQSDADVLLDMVREMNAVTRLEKLDEVAVRNLSYTARGDLAPINAFIGGLAAQEVIKACSGKFTPLRQWLYFDALECLSEGESEVAETSFSAKCTRYDGQVAVFGSAFQEKLKKQKYFLVGAGAIGCELLKNFALMGLGAGGEGQITVTDMDFIERSNLNRQFLFRSQDIGKPKSEVAAKAVRDMNPRMNITAHQNRLDPDSEGVYGYDFFKGLDGVAAALDNVEARVYLDGRCVQHQKPMLEGGTLGSKGHTLVVVPHLTESYGPDNSSSKDEIPLCTLKNFPHRIEHTLQWARDQFEGLFKKTPENVNLFLRDEGFVKRTLDHNDAEASEVLGDVWSSLRDMKVEDNLLHCFPANEVTSSGLPFWSGSKRCPHPLIFNPDNTTHMEYVVAAANLYGHIYGIEGTRDGASIARILDKVQVPSFTPSSSVTIHANDTELEESRERGRDDAEDARLEELKGKLASLKSSDMRMYPIDFEKDDDSNFHMDFIVAASNLRAENYDIAAADRHQSKRIAGRIIPAIATTTAAVAGLMCLELYKLVQGLQNIRSYRTTYINLAVQYFVMTQPNKPRQFQVAGQNYTLWDDFLVEGRRGNQQEMTLGELIQYIKEKYNLSICSLFYGAAAIYSGQVERLQLSVSDVVRKVSKADIPPHKKMLELTPMFEEEEDDCDSVVFIRYLLL